MVNEVQVDLLGKVSCSPKHYLVLKYFKISRHLVLLCQSQYLSPKDTFEVPWSFFVQAIHAEMELMCLKTKTFYSSQAMLL